MLFYIFVFLIPLIVWIVLRGVSKRKEEAQPRPQALLEDCALCHEEFQMDELVEKEVGEYGRVYCFCGKCIEKLYREYQAKKGSANK